MQRTDTKLQIVILSYLRGGSSSEILRSWPFSNADVKNKVGNMMNYCVHLITNGIGRNLLYQFVPLTQNYELSSQFFIRSTDFAILMPKGLEEVVNYGIGEDRAEGILVFHLDLLFKN